MRSPTARATSSTGSAAAKATRIESSPGSTSSAWPRSADAGVRADRHQFACAGNCLASSSREGDGPRGNHLPPFHVSRMMPRYFFHIFESGHSTRDDAGIDLDSHREVQAQAMRVLPEIAVEEVPRDGDHQAFMVHVTDEFGQPVYMATLTFAGVWLHQTPSGDHPTPGQRGGSTPPQS